MALSKNWLSALRYDRLCQTVLRPSFRVLTRLVKPATSTACAEFVRCKIFCPVRRPLNNYLFCPQQVLFARRELGTSNLFDGGKTIQHDASGTMNLQLDTSPFFRIQDWHFHVAYALDRLTTSICLRCMPDRHRETALSFTFCFRSHGGESCIIDWNLMRGTIAERKPSL